METGFPNPYDALSDPIPTVDPGDLKKVWDLYRDREVRHPSQNMAIGLDLMGLNCIPGANVVAVWYRCSMLGLMRGIGMLSPWLQNDQLDEAVFRVAATFPMNKMPAGTPSKVLPFDLEAFFKEVRSQSEK